MATDDDKQVWVTPPAYHNFDCSRILLVPDHNLQGRKKTQYVFSVIVFFLWYGVFRKDARPEMFRCVPRTKKPTTKKDRIPFMVVPGFEPGIYHRTCDRFTY